MPESSLPASKAEIKVTLIENAVIARKRGGTDDVRVLRSCYRLLADFVPEEVAEDLRASTAETKDLMEEFDGALRSAFPGMAAGAGSSAPR